jgi:phage protein D
MRGVALPSSSYRTPSVAVLAGGVPLPGVMDVDILANAHLAAARFRIRAALTPSDAVTLLPPGTLLDLQFSLGGGPISLLQGEADSVSIDPINMTAEIDGRDLTARLLDARTQETFANQTAGEIANTLAGRNSLTPVVTATTTLAGRYYGTEHDRITLGQFARATTEWDLLTFLAAREGFEVFVVGQQLCFQPRSTSAAPLLLTPDDCISLSLERSMALAKGVQVTVKSWNTHNQAAVTQSARSQSTSAQAGATQPIVVVRPNLSSDAAAQLAQRILTDLAGHERLVHATLPGELTLTPRSPVTLSGTGTDFDQTYYVAELDRHFSADSGFTQRLQLKSIDSTTSSATATASVGLS